MLSQQIGRKSRFKTYFHGLVLTILGGIIEKILNHISAKGEMVKAWQWWIELTYLDNRALFRAKIEPIIAAPKPANSHWFSQETPLKKFLTKKVTCLQEIHYRVKTNLLVFLTLWKWQPLCISSLELQPILNNSTPKAIIK